MLPDTKVKLFGSDMSPEVMCGELGPCLGAVGDRPFERWDWWKVSGGRPTGAVLAKGTVDSLTLLLFHFLGNHKAGWFCSTMLCGLIINAGTRVHLILEWKLRS